MAETSISKIVGTDSDTGLQIRVDVTGVMINMKSKTIDITYDECLIGKSGSVVTKKSGVYTRRNKEAVMDLRQVAGEPEGVTEQYEVTPAENRFDQLEGSEIGILIKQMLENDLKNYPNM